MGWAKYAEDNMEIFNNRMYDKGINSISFKEFKKKVRHNLELISKEEEYQLVLRELIKIDRWLELVNDMANVIHTPLLLKFLNDQKKYLLADKESYINYRYDPKFKTLRNVQVDRNKINFKDYISNLIKKYALYIIDNMKEIKNNTDHEAIILNSLLLDLEDFAKKYLDINKKTLQVPLVKYVRENVIKEEKIVRAICNKCGEKTYSDFNHCIYCKYTRGDN
ncbi:hypothetical protein SAMN05660462_01319 [Proteiniborus ethanoligenes]|uniref:Uncharacterized protein n=1 Tax=Proteiniborus ethanoligenes TaxID=415015 RepID=A0A1H3P0Z5_9FIRM|nr:hypothetical protein [Proteiniborus ethanoligenes]SDY94643.1 hypothetical protein SAMN05660462_01319 [Proteiniborus ethanoligenes]